MKPNHKITLAVAFLAAGTAMHAQNTAGGTAGSSESAGLLGQRYTEFSVGLQDIKNSADHAYSVGASANDPVIPGVLDAGAAYSYSWRRGPFGGHANTIGGYATAYAPLRGVKPFVGTGLAYQWSSRRLAGSDEQALWGLTAGVEIPAGRVTVTPRVNYADDFEGTRRSVQAWTYQVEANYWYTRTSAVFATLGKSEIRRSSQDAWTYEVGLRSRF